MKPPIYILIFIVLGWLVSLILPIWWFIAVIAFFIALLIKLSPKSGFLHLFIGGFILWGGMALSLHLQSDSTISSKISDLFGIGSNWLLFVITALIGGLISGLAGWSGASLNRLINRKNG
jgi:hypothetical protein